MKSLSVAFSYSALLFFTLFFALLPWIFIDVDQGDQAFHTIHSWLLAFVNRPEAGPGYWQDTTAFWGSLYIGSIWWRFIGSEAGLVEFRIGWILLNIFTSQVLFWIFRTQYNERKAFFAILLTSLVVNCAADHFVISYNSAAPAMGAISFALLALSFSDSQENKKWALFFGAGFFACIGIFARLPSLPFVFLLLFLSIALTIFADKKIHRGINLFLFFGFGALTAFLLFYFALKSTNQWNMYRDGFWDFFHAVASDSSEKHTKGATIARALGHYYKITIGVFLFCAFAILLTPIQKLFNKIAFVICLIIFLLLAGTKYGIALSILIGGSLLIGSFAIFKDFRRIDTVKLIFFLAGGIQLTAFTFGTNLEGLQNYKYGMWILFPFALLELEKIKFRFFDSKKVFYFLSAAAFILFLCTRLQWPTFPYFENPIFTMKYTFKAPKLKGILTYEEKSVSLNSLYEFLQTRGVGPNTSLMAYSAVSPFYPIALVYFMSKTTPPFHNPTMVEYPGTSWVKHKKVIEDLVNKGKFAEIVVRQTKPFPIRKNGLYSLNPFSPQEAPTTQANTFSWEKIESLGAANELDIILKNSGYQLLWENSHFVVLERKR